MQSKRLSRRNALSAAGAGLAWLGSTRDADAADWTAAEHANVRVVNDFYAAWPSHDLQKVTSFFADDGIGVFFLRDGKIVEWYDYTIATERA